MCVSFLHGKTQISVEKIKNVYSPIFFSFAYPYAVKMYELYILIHPKESLIICIVYSDIIVICVSFHEDFVL